MAEQTLIQSLMEEEVLLLIFGFIEKHIGINSFSGFLQVPLT